MNSVSRKIFTLGVLFMATVAARAQINTAYLDSIPLAKPKQQKLYYTFNHPRLASVKIKSTKYNAGKYTPGAALKDMGADMIADVFGHVTDISTTREVTWELKTRLLCQDKSLSWDIAILCPGRLYKEKELQHDPATGDEVVVTVRYSTFYWQEGAVGIIEEHDRIISNFEIIVDPAEDSLLYDTYYDVFQDPPRTLALKSKSANPYYEKSLHTPYREYAVVGRFRGEKFALVTNGVSHTMWFFVNDVLACVFYPDLDFMPILRVDRVNPYLLLDPDIGDDQLADWYRLAMFSRYLFEELSIN